MSAGSVVTLVAGLASGCYGLAQMRKVRQLRRTGVTAVGTVVDHERIFDDGSLYSPVIVFFDEGGARHQFTVAVRASWRIHRVGQEVGVIHPPGLPGAARLSSASYNGWTIGLPLAAGALFVLSGLLLR
jgi:hypothetical protein